MPIEWKIPGVLAGSSRPGRHLGREVAVPQALVEAWIEDARRLGIASIICLLDAEHLSLYRAPSRDLLDQYRAANFHLIHEPVADHVNPPLSEEELERVWAAFQSLPKPVVIHCSAGIDRTGAAIEYIRRRLVDHPHA